MLNKEKLLKIFEQYKSDSTGGIYMTKWDAMADDILSSQNAAKPTVMRSVCVPSHHNLDVLHLGCCSKCGGTRFSQTDV